MKKFELNMKEKEKYTKIKEYVDYGDNKNRIALHLCIFKRQVDCLMIKYKENGKAGFVHCYRTRKPIYALDNSISEDIILLFKNKYYDFNFNHFKEFLEKYENFMNHINDNIDTPVVQINFVIEKCGKILLTITSFTLAFLLK